MGGQGVARAGDSSAIPISIVVRPELGLPADVGIGIVDFAIAIVVEAVAGLRGTGLDRCIGIIAVILVRNVTRRFATGGFRYRSASIGVTVRILIIHHLTGNTNVSIIRKTVTIVVIAVALFRSTGIHGRV